MFGCLCSRRRVLATLATSIRLSAGLALVPAHAQTPRKLTLVLDLLPNGEYAAFFLALDKGWYREEGLDVEILRGSGGLDTVKRIAAGQGDVGIADFSTIVAGIANEGAKVKAIAPVFRAMPNALFVRRNEGINSIKDLVGKSIAVTVGNSHQVLWPLVAKANGIAVDSVKWVTMDAASMAPSLITKRVDAAPQALWHEKRLSLQSAMQGVSLRPLPYSANGVDAYSLTLFARTDSIEKNPEPLRRFLRATVRAIEYTWQKSNSREGAEAVVKLNPIVELEGAVGAAEVAGALAIDEDIRRGRFAIGQADPVRVDRMRDMYVQFLNLKRSPARDEIFTNSLLPAVK